jgi:hypothetical protein
MQFRHRPAAKGERTEAPRIYFVILNQYFAAARGASTKVLCLG